MLKSFSLFTILLLVTTQALAMSKTQVEVVPVNPHDWGYMGATVIVGQQAPQSVGTGITLAANLHDRVNLQVFAMNAAPNLASSCQNLQIKEKGRHQLLFMLNGDWLIHCQWRVR